MPNIQSLSSAATVRVLCQTKATKGNKLVLSQRGNVDGEGKLLSALPRRLRIRLSGGRRRWKIDNLSQICFSNFHVAPIAISADLLSVDSPIGGARPEIRFNIVRKAESQCLTSNVMVAEFLRNFHSIFLSVPTTFHDIFPLKMNPSNVQQVTSPFFFSPLKRLEVFATREPRAVLAHSKICCKLKNFLLSAAAVAPHLTPPPHAKSRIEILDAVCFAAAFSLSTSGRRTTTVDSRARITQDSLSTLHTTLSR